jgi:hypothetical protein
LRAVIFDNSVNLPAIRGIIDKGKIATAGIPELGKILKEVVGFPGMLLAFTKNSASHFDPVVSIIESGFVRAEPELNEKVEVEKPADSDGVVENKLARPKIQLLVRKEKSGRVFRPNSSSSAAVTKKSSKPVPGSGFISFSNSDEKKISSYKNTVINFV